MKKLFTLMALLLITSTSAYTFYSGRLNASNPYASGGSITGRINKSPANLIVQNEHMRKGDRILMGVTNPYTNDPLSWQLIRKQTYNDYGCSTPSVSCNNSNTINAWLSLTNNPVGYMKAGFIPNDFTVAGGAIATSFTDLQDRRVAFTSYRNVVSLLDSLNTDVKNSNDKMILTYRDLTLIHKIYNVEGGAINTRGAASMKQSIFARTSDHMDSLFLPNSYELIPEAFNTNASLVPPAKDIAFSNNYMSSAAGWDTTNLASCILILESGTRNLSLMGNNWDNENFIRLEAFLNMENVVFGVSPGNATTLGNITVPTLSSSYTRLYQDAVGEPMKVRIENSVLSSSTSFHQIENAAQNAISKAAKNESVYLNVDAQTGNDGAGGIYTVSALIFNENGDFLYYKPLEAAKGRGQYELNLTGIPIGKYKIGVVNEAYNENSTAPADCSAITNVQALEIVEPHKITYTKTPQSGASAGKEYEFSKNVNAGQAVGKVTANSTGVTPLTYSVEANGDNSYLNFEIDGLDSNNASSNTPLNVKIKSGAPDLVNGGLKAGNYKFCVTAVDANGDPVDTSGNPTEKVCTSFTVEKTNPTIAFNDPAQTKKSIADAATAWNETATATPSTGTKIAYSITGGDVSLISINPDTGAITYTGSNAFGKVKIRATVDDDPSTGRDNYNSAFVEKEIVIYREVDGSVTPDSNSSDTTIPTFSASDSNIRTGGIIGTIHGTLGTPDTIGGTTTTYHYGLKPGVGNASFFSVDTNTGVIKTTANLGVNSYHITVTVSDNWSTKEIPVKINVGVAAAENLKFYENSTSTTAITTKSAALTDTGVVVYATVRGSSNTNPVKYSIQDGSTNVIEVNENSGAVTIHGVGTVTVVAKKQGAAGQAEAIAYLTFTVTAGAQNFIYTDSAGNELPKSGSNYSAKTETYEPSKSFQLYTAGNPTGSTVSYQLKAGSPTDVISVDANGLVTILNASLNNQMGKVIVEATSHDPSGNYADKTIELSINIEKGTRTISFKENPIYAVSGNGSVTPVIEVDDVIDTDGDVLIEVDHNEDSSIAWTSDNKTIEYDYSEPNPKDIKIHATKPMNRNYKAAEADGVLHIMGPDENVLAITSPGKITYGDRFTIRSSQYDADSTNVQYKFEVDDTTYISNPTVSGNSAGFDAKQFSGSNKTTITVTRTADGETPLSKQVQVSVLPKPIEIVIDDKEKLKGEQNPSLTYQDFKNKLVSWTVYRM